MTISLKSEVDGVTGTVQVNNTDIITIKDTGNVGIGTSSPTALRTKNFQISSSGTNDGTAIIASKRGTGYATLRLNSADATAGWDINYNWPTTGCLSFHDIGSATTRLNIDSSGNVLVISATGLGYGTGAGGTATQQITSRSTGVTLNKPTGRFQLFSTTTTAGTFASFTLTNSTIAANDVVIVNFASGATANSYGLSVTDVAAGSCRIQIHNIAAVGVAEAPFIQFAVIKGATA